MIIIIDEASAKLASFYYHDEIFKPQWKRAVEMTSAPADCIWIVSNRQQKQIADSLGIASVGEPQCGTRYAVESLAEIDIEYLERVRRRYNHIPWDIGETDRCLIRELSLSDLPALYELYDNKICTGDEAAECRACLARRMQSVGYELVTDSTDPGDDIPLPEEQNPIQKILDMINNGKDTDDIILEKIKEAFAGFTAWEEENHAERR